MEYLSPFYEVADRPFEYAADWKKKHNGKVIGHFCSYTPEEIIFAGGLLPFRLFSASVNPLLSDAHFQSYCCNLVRSVLNDALAGNLEFLDGAVFPHTCDSIQRLSDIWRMNLDFSFHADVVLPAKVGADSAKIYMVEVLKKFKRTLEDKLDIGISEGKLKEAIGKYNRLRAYIRKIYAIKRANPYCISGKDIQTVVKASMLMDRNEFLSYMPDLVEILENCDRQENEVMKRLLIAGGTCNIPEIYQIVEDADGIIVYDDLCTGARYADGEIDPSGDAIESIARRYLEKEVCPAKHNGLNQRGERLVQRVRDYHADGVIFLNLKFCDPHAFDHPYLQSQMKTEGIPSLLLEIEGPQTSGEQLKTRCEAFIETL
ncbi:2-hydroxyacyl-CoA dehydratase subunit D [Thermodesulfobacteriota bacterium]